MRIEKNNLLTLILIIILAGICQTTSAQFNIKIPKIGKPKKEEAKVEQPNTDANQSAPNESKSNENRSSSNQSNYLDDPARPKTPQIMLETLEIKAHNQAKYFKTPANNDNPSWFPQVAFQVFYAADSPTLRYTANWTNPDGSTWFSEPLEMNYGGDFPDLRSPFEDKDLEPKAIIVGGTYGLKITDTKTNQTVFQGKFKVNKLPLAPPTDHKLLFYVENDWNMSVGYVGFKKNNTDYEVHTRPMAFFWFKGVLDENQFEGELYYNSQRVATTDKGGSVNKYGERGADCFLARAVCAHTLLGFEWDNFVVDNARSARKNNPNGYFTNDHAGEYTIKVFYKGDQVREAKFTIDAKGLPARNVFSDQIFLNDYRVIVPVKVMGTLEKWNAASWKIDAFYGNLLKGFNVP